MEVITELKIRRHTVYARMTLDSAGMPAAIEHFDCRVTKKKENGKTLYIITDKDGNIRRDPYRYLNETINFRKDSTRRQIAIALNLLHTWCDITARKPENLSPTDISEMMNFLWGVTVRPLPDGTRTIRTAKTVNAYYSFIKEYIHKNGWNASAFEYRIPYILETTLGDITVKSVRTRDPNRLKTDSLERKRTPQHLTPDMVNAFVKAVIDARDEETFLLSRLQLAHGLRRGEALGITLEDLKKRRNRTTGEYAYYIILRNRCSDADDQHCKELCWPSSKDEYSKESYIKAERWDIKIPEDLYNRLLAFYDNIQKKFTGDRRKRMLLETEADVVEPNGPFAGKKNYYIFVNKTGRRLTGQSYNNHLKKYFDQVGIPVDRGIKQTSCSHRLRHTFAMFLSTYGKETANVEQLRILMRHRYVSSGQAYYTPTPEETLKMKERFTDSIYEIIPDLKNTKF